jgi:hypothetical protein
VARAPLPAPADQGLRASVDGLALARLPQRPPAVDGADRTDRDHQGSLEPERHRHTGVERLEDRERRPLRVAATLTDWPPSGKVEGAPGEVGAD